MRKTKIVCTIGPACDNEETLTKMCLEGMNVARLNFSHGTHEGHKAMIDLIKRVREKLGLPIAIMLDTKGPEYRIGCFENKSVELAEGDSFTFTTEAGSLENLNGRSFQVEGVDFVKEYFPEAGKRIFVE